MWRGVFKMEGMYLNRKQRRLYKILFMFIIRLGSCNIEKLHFDKGRGGGSLTRNEQNNDFLFRFVII